MFDSVQYVVGRNCFRYGSAACTYTRAMLIDFVIDKSVNESCFRLCACAVYFMPCTTVDRFRLSAFEEANETLLIIILFHLAFCSCRFDFTGATSELLTPPLVLLLLQLLPLITVYGCIHSFNHF